MIQKIFIKIGRFGSETMSLELNKDATIQEALEEAGISLGGTDKVWVNGERANQRDILEDGDTVNIVTPKEAGSDEETTTEEADDADEQVEEADEAIVDDSVEEASEVNE